VRAKEREASDCWMSVVNSTAGFELTPPCIRARVRAATTLTPGRGAVARVPRSPSLIQSSVRRRKNVWATTEIKAGEEETEGETEYRALYCFGPISQRAANASSSRRTYQEALHPECASMRVK